MESHKPRNLNDDQNWKPNADYDLNLNVSKWVSTFINAFCHVTSCITFSRTCIRLQSTSVQCACFHGHFFKMTAVWNGVYLETVTPQSTIRTIVQILAPAWQLTYNNPQNETGQSSWRRHNISGNFRGCDVASHMLRTFLITCKGHSMICPIISWDISWDIRIYMADLPNLYGKGLIWYNAHCNGTVIIVRLHATRAYSQDCMKHDSNIPCISSHNILHVALESNAVKAITLTNWLPLYNIFDHLHHTSIILAFQSRKDIMSSNPICVQAFCSKIRWKTQMSARQHWYTKMLGPNCPESSWPCMTGTCLLQIVFTIL